MRAASRHVMTCRHAARRPDAAMIEANVNSSIARIPQFGSRLTRSLDRARGSPSIDRPVWRWPVPCLSPQAPVITYHEVARGYAHRNPNGTAYVAEFWLLPCRPLSGTRLNSNTPGMSGRLLT